MYTATHILISIKPDGTRESLETLHESHDQDELNRVRDVMSACALAEGITLPQERFAVRPL